MEKLSLSLTLLPIDRPLPKGQLPDAIIRLSNDGDDTIFVNGRMLLVPAGSPGTINELNLFVDGPPESFSLKRFSVNAGQAQAENFIQLTPGQYIERNYVLDDYFYYDQPGQYTAKAKYHNEVAFERSGYKSWQGDIESNVVNFEMSE